MADPASDTGDGARQPGVPQVLLLAAAIVAIVLTVAAISTFVPGVTRLFADSPLIIAILIGGSVFVVWRILRPPSAS